MTPKEKFLEKARKKNLALAEEHSREKNKVDRRKTRDKAARKWRLEMETKGPTELGLLMQKKIPFFKDAPEAIKQKIKMAEALKAAMAYEDSKKKVEP